MRSARRVIVVVLLVQVGWMAVAAVALSFLGLAFLVGFGAGALAVLAVLLGFLLVWQRTDARRESLLRAGTRVPALLVSSRATNVQINRRRVMAHTFESRAGGTVRAVARAFGHLQVGTEATIAYDTSDPRRAVVVEDLDAMATEGQLDWQTLRRQATDRRFRRS